MYIRKTHKKNLFMFIAIAIVMLAGSFSDASAKQRVTWVSNDFIPFFIPNGPFKGQGISDKLTAFFQKHLPQYEHHQEHMNFPRFFAMAKRGDLVCNPLLLKTKEREKFLTFSHAYKPAYAHIMVSAHPIDYPLKGLDFESFLKQDPHPLFVQTKRSYGPILDQIIKKGIANKRITVANFPTEQLFTMLENGRITHFLDIENSVTYYNKLHQGDKKFYNVPLEEDRLDRFGYAVCSKTAEGQKLISQINEILEREGESREFRDILESWMATENLNRFREFYYREILKK